MSVIIDLLKKARTRSADAETGQSIQASGEKSSPGSSRIIVFAVIFILGIVITISIFHGFNTNIASITQSSRLVEKRMENIENTSEYFNNNLKTLNVRLEDLTSGIESIKTKAASDEESAKSLLSEIKGIKTAIKNLQNKYSSVSEQTAELKKNIDMLAANTAEKN